MKAMTIVELIILESDILDDIQDRDAKDVPWSNVDDAFNLNIVVGMLIICLQETDGKMGVNETVSIKQKINELMMQSLKGAFPNENALLKVLYFQIKEPEKKWEGGHILLGNGYEPASTERSGKILRGNILYLTSPFYFRF